MLKHFMRWSVFPVLFGCLLLVGCGDTKREAAANKSEKAATQVEEVDKKNLKYQGNPDVGGVDADLPTVSPSDNAAQVNTSPKASVGSPGPMGGEGESPLPRGTTTSPNSANVVVEGIPLPNSPTPGLAPSPNLPVSGSGAIAAGRPPGGSAPARQGGLPGAVPALPKPVVADPEAKPQANAAPVQEGAGAEDYNHFKDNEYKAVKNDPLSTFSADVNTASYSIVRRMLASGQKPPRDSVRLAEWVNYFPYSYPTPTDDKPVAFDLEIGPCHWQPKHLIARIGLKAKQIDPKNTPPRNLVFLVDTSGSMAGDTRLPLVQKSLNLLIDRLTAKDLVTIVTYAGESTLKLPPTPGDMRAKIREAVNGLYAGGSTNGGGGIEMAYQKARQSFIENGANRVILCTDGDFNVGITNQGDLVSLIEKERKANVFLTVLGYGMGNLKDSTLEKLANHGNGHYAYIDSESEAYKVFVEQGAALVTVAKDVKLQVEFNPARVSAYRLLGYENRLLKNEDFRNDAKDAGDMGSGHTVTALYEIVPAGVKLEVPGVDPLKYQQTDTKLTEAAKSGEWFTVKMRYKHPLASTSLEVAKGLPAGSEKKPESKDYRFAVAVAELAMLLRESPYKGVASFDSVIETAEANLGDDPGKHRAEFVAMARQARRTFLGEGKQAGR